MDGRTDPNYRKASLFKYKIYSGKYSKSDTFGFYTTGFRFRTMDDNFILMIILEFIGKVYAMF